MMALCINCVNVFSGGRAAFPFAAFCPASSSPPKPPEAPSSSWSGHPSTLPTAKHIPHEQSLAPPLRQTRYLLCFHAILPSLCHCHVLDLSPPFSSVPVELFLEASLTSICLGTTNKAEHTGPSLLSHLQTRRLISD